MRRFIRGLVGLCLLGSVLLVPSPAHAGVGQSTWSSATLAPGSSQTWHWNNAGATSVYQVGLSPQGATAAATCEFETVREWYVQRLNSGVSELEFYFTIKNVGTITCYTDITLGWVNTTTTLGTTTVAAGDSGGTWYYYDDPGTTTAVVPAFTPRGATSANPCQFEVSLIQIATAEGSRRHAVTIENTGAISCQVDVRLAAIPLGNSWASGTMSPYTTKTWHWNNANPATAVYAVGITPAQEFKWWGVERTWYVQRINSDGSAEREFYLTVRHYNSATSGSAQILLTRVA
ncbi:hypothetical protein QEZ54_23545 [Catellatospora sp. KI3]|uniref:hypothetical protein n=1 Tax=Catellatospora sp. KI3 TaxID=3041620 RepID=UPI002482D27E|nr:hypothetical protein [Catellatospora sp. KI3]MDI1463964.1 hypothetical protein [Catellatospora sp. KI3]